MAILTLVPMQRTAGSDVGKSDFGYCSDHPMRQAERVHPSSQPFFLGFTEGPVELVATRGLHILFKVVPDVVLPTNRWNRAEIHGELGKVVRFIA